MRTVGTAFRPLIHVEDLARAYAAVLTAPTKAVHNEIFNIVGADGNHRVITIADAVTDLVPDSTRSANKSSFDPRSYRVDGGKLRRTFPGLSLRWRLPGGIRQLFGAMRSAGLTPGDWRSDRYRRVLRLQALMQRGDVDTALRRRQEVLA